MIAIKPLSRISTSLVLVISVFALTFSTLGVTPASAAYPINIPGPANSWRFGESVTLLPNGNFVVVDSGYPSYEPNVFQGMGAVYLYSPNRVLISRLVGDRNASDVGSGGITVLANGNFVVNSPFWSSPTLGSVGAVTWCSGVTGCNGTVSAANSLIGPSNSDLVGFGGVTALANGNYVISSPHWSNGGPMWAGAVTWANGSHMTSGVVTAANSLIGSTANDQLGDPYYDPVHPLSNGNYLVLSPVWDNGSAVDAGAVTWGNGLGGTVGPVSAANSLVGSTTSDSVGSNFMYGTWLELPNGNYVVVSTSWDLDATHPDVGAVTWGSGTSGVAGPISASNSLIGNSKASPVADWSLTNFGVTPLTNGNYVVSSPHWSPRGTDAAWGAATWADGTTGISGQISASNSLVGSATGDVVANGNFFGDGSVIPLTNGNYVVTSYWWNDQGAVTWGNGATGITGSVSSSNSLVGKPDHVIALTNGNYVVDSPGWSPGGAVAWGDGTAGTTGDISAANSLIGGAPGTAAGNGGLVPLTNGNYVVINTAPAGMSSVTWVDGSHAAIGTISAANSLTGSTADDQVGQGMYGGGVKALANGNYVVISPYWDAGANTDVGAITWGDGAHGTTGVVSASNSLVGSTADDQLGSDSWHGSVTILTNGNYVVSAPQWDNGSVVDAGAVVWGNGAGGSVGPLSASNSLVGSTTGDMGVEGPFGGDFEVLALPNGNYIVDSPAWTGAPGVGAVTWGNGSSGTVGPISASNSLVNTCPSDPNYCPPKTTFLPDGRVAMHFQVWSNGSHNGAISLIAGLPNITVGPITTSNSVLGTAPNWGGTMVAAYNAARTELIVGRPHDNMVTILSPVPGPVSLTVRSVGTADGWVLESSENSNQGGGMESASTTLRLGDDAAKKQYRDILSFSTGPSLPDNAAITKVTLKLKKSSVTGGGNPVSMFQGFMVDVKTGTFGTSALQFTDFQAAGSKTLGPFTPALAGGWYSVDLTNAKANINKLAASSGLTQIRLRFKLDDNNNNIANYLNLFSGDAPLASRPQLVIQYYVP